MDDEPVHVIDLGNCVDAVAYKTYVYIYIRLNKFEDMHLEQMVLKGTGPGVVWIKTGFANLKVKLLLANVFSTCVYIQSRITETPH